VKCPDNSFAELRLIIHADARYWGIYRSTVMSVLDRAVRSAMCIVFAATLVGWGNSEADQRKAFIAFLQDIDNRAGAQRACAERQ